MTSPSLIAYELSDGIATITMDDGKANVMSEAMLQALGTALDRAAADGAVVLLTGRPRMFSGGYDTAMFTRSRDEILRTLRAGGETVHRLLGFARPVVIACNGHAIAQGAFTLLSADVRIGVDGPFKIGLNEVAIGLTIPYYGIEAARHRLATPWFHHATATGTLYPPDEALRAGFLDRVVAPDDLATVARAEAVRLTTVDATAHRGTKERARATALAAIRDGITRELS